MLLSTSPPAGAEDRTHTGKVHAISNDRLEIGNEYGLVSIGFVADKDVARKLSEIRQGDEVRAVLGSAPRKGGGRINKLLSIRRCVQQDAECSADRERDRLERTEREAKLAEINAWQQQCNEAMHDSMPERFRDALITSTSEGRSAHNWSMLSPEERTCAQRFIEDYRNAFLGACRLHRCGENIGGGCAHIAGYSTTPKVVDASIRSCRLRND